MPNSRDFYSPQALSQSPQGQAYDRHRAQNRNDRAQPAEQFVLRSPPQAPAPPQNQGFNIQNLMGNQNWGNWEGIQSGGGTSIEGVGNVQAGNQVPLAQSIVNAQSEALGNQLGLLGSLANTQGGVEQSRIGAGAQMHGANQQLAGQLGTATIDAETRELIARLQNELGFHQTDTGAETNRLGINTQAETARGATAAQLQAALANVASTDYATDQELIARQYAADAANEGVRLQNERAVQFGQPMFEKLAAMMFGGGTAQGLGGSGPTDVQQFDRERGYAENAAREAAALNSGGYSGGSPQAGAASQAAALTRAMADTGTETEYARNAQQFELDQIAAESDLMRAQAAQFSPFASLLGQYA